MSVDSSLQFVQSSHTLISTASVFSDTLKLTATMTENLTPEEVSILLTASSAVIDAMAGSMSQLVESSLETHDNLQKLVDMTENLEE